MSLRVLSALLLVAGLAGCTGSHSVSVAGQGYASGTQSKTVECGTSATISLGAQGGGSLTVTVKDGAGSQVFSQTVSSGQDGTSQSLSGKTGTWTLSVATGMGFGGQYGIVLSC